MLGRRMESDVVQWRRKKWKNDFKKLDGAIHVLIIDGILVVPDSGNGTRYFVTNEEDAIIPRIGLDLGYGRAGPSFNRWLLSHRVAHEIK
jgi:hypothetical protein